MTSTPVSLQDESLNGSWIDIKNASQIPSQIDDAEDSERGCRGSQSTGQSFGLISFQVERFLQEVHQRNQSSRAQHKAEDSQSTITATTTPATKTTDPSITTATLTNTSSQQDLYEKIAANHPSGDDGAFMYMSDTDVSLDESGRALYRSFKRYSSHTHHHHHGPADQHDVSNNNVDSSRFDRPLKRNHSTTASFCQLEDYSALKSPTLKSSQPNPKFQNIINNNNNDNNDNNLLNGEFLMDQLSDSLSFLSHVSAFGVEDAFAAPKEYSQQQPFDWLWDWTDEPQYWAGLEWKLCSLPAKHDHIMRQRQMYYANYPPASEHSNKANKHFSGDMMSLLFLTNLLSILIGAGLTYSILVHRSSM